MLTLLIQEARLSATMRGVEMDCREALYPGCIGVTEKALDKMSFWQKIKIVGRHSLQKIFAYLMVLSLLLILPECGVSVGVASVAQKLSDVRKEG